MIVWVLPCSEWFLHCNIYESRRSPCGGVWTANKSVYYSVALAATSVVHFFVSLWKCARLLYRFSCSLGSTKCRHPLSMLTTCLSPSQVAFNFEPCPSKNNNMGASKGKAQSNKINTTFEIFFLFFSSSQNSCILYIDIFFNLHYNINGMNEWEWRVNGGY